MKSKAFKDIIALCAPYKKELLSNFLMNIVNSIFSLFTFLSVVPFLYILFKVQNKSAVGGGNNKWWEIAEQALNGYVERHGEINALMLMCGVIVILALLKNLTNYLSLLSIAKVRTAISRDLRSKLYAKTLRLSVAFYTHEKKGDLISRMTNDLMEIEFSVIGALEALLKAPIMLVISIVTLFVISWQLTLFALIFLPVSGILISRIAKSLKNAAKRGKGSLGELISVIEETLTGMRVVKVFNAEKYFAQKFNDENESYFKLMHRLYRREYLSSPMSEFISMSVIAILLFVGGKIVLDYEMSGALLIGYLVVFSQVIQPARALSEAVFKVSKGAASLERVNEIMHADESVQDGIDASEMNHFEGDISFQGVSFGYGDKGVLRNISFTVKKGQTVALVGPSGSGKSTIASLMVRLMDPKSGDILVDGVSLRNRSIASWRNHIGVVTQDSILFNDTIAKNIALGSDEVNHERVVSVAKMANALEFIEQCPGQWEFNVGDGGSKLSGGQKQRLCIARALYKNPPILILDEATSALDTQSEQLVQEAIQNMMKDRTSVVIAHRLSTVQNADCILVIDHGEIVQKGKHTELMQQEGLYKTLVELQELG
jgi:subfamily B ATP-binding cassette protein MsbA